MTDVPLSDSDVPVSDADVPASGADVPASDADVPVPDSEAPRAPTLADRATIIREAAEQLYAAAEDNLDEDVPTCPDWKLGDLAWHLGEVHWSWGTIVAEGITERPRDRELPQRPDDDALLDWCREQTARLAAALAASDPDDPAWNWSFHDQNAAWIARRMTQETIVHRWDAQRAVGRGDEIPADLAVEGLDELLTVMLAASGPYEGRPGALRLRATDADRSWDVDLFPPVPTVHHDDTNRMVDLVVEGPAADLLLALWGRATAAGLTFDGPAEPFESLRDHLDTE